jgi:hypothetical protein
MIVSAALLSLVLALPGPPPQSGGEKAAASALLRRVYDEVRSFGTAAPALEAPVQQDFFIGGPDDDDTNKDVHVVVLLYRAGGFEMMKLQVTTLVRSRSDPRVKKAAGSKACACRVDLEGITVFSSDLEEKELARTAAELLKAIADKKRLIRGSGAP